MRRHADLDQEEHERRVELVSLLNRVLEELGRRDALVSLVEDRTDELGRARAEMAKLRNAVGPLLEELARTRTDGGEHPYVSTARRAFHETSEGWS